MSTAHMKLKALPVTLTIFERFVAADVVHDDENAGDSEREPETIHRLR